MARNTNGLRPWQPGQSGNPKGRPRGARAVLDVVGVKKREEILLVLADRALQGDVAAARVILERTDPALRRQELSGVEGGPLEVDTRAVAKLLSREDLLEIRAVAAKIAARSEARASGEEPRLQETSEESPSSASAKGVGVG